MSKRKFRIEFDGIITVELDEQVINTVDDEWRSMLYELHTPEEIAEHIAFNLLEGRTLDGLDGWADQPESNAKLVAFEVWDVEVEEFDKFQVF